MEKLDICRHLIDSIDNSIIELYEKRMDVIKEITKYKIENGLPVLDQAREDSMLKKNLKKIKNEEYKKYYKDVLDGYLKASKKMQEEIIKIKISKDI